MEREEAGIAALVARTVEAAGDLVGRDGERRLDAGAAGGVENVEPQAVVAQDRRIADPALERRRVAMKVEQTAFLAVVGEAGLGDELLQRRLGIDAESELAGGVAARRLGRAIGEKAQAPGPHARIETELQPQRLIIAKERAPEDLRRPRRSPGKRVTGRDEPGIGKARLGGWRRLAVDHRDAVAFLGEVIGARHADHPGPHDHRVRSAGRHRTSLSADLRSPR